MHQDHITSTLAFLDESEWWLPVVGWLGYEVSDLGRIRSFKLNGGHWTLRVGPESRHVAAPRLLEGHVRKDGYIKVSLGKANGRIRKSFGVHVLVLEAFSGPRPEGYQACHNDGDPANNRVTNLRWDTQSANQIDCVRHGLSRRFRLTETDIPEIWRRLVEGDGPSTIGADFGVSFDVIAAIRARRSWTHITRTLPGRPAHELNAILVDAAVRPDPALAHSKFEIWRAIRDWPAYRVSNYGRVQSRYMQSGGGWMLGERWWPRKLGAKRRRSGHFTFQATSEAGASKLLFVHQIVLEAFVCPRPLGLVACHNDGDPGNNHLANLRWDTQRANCLDRHLHQKRKLPFKSIEHSSG